MTRKIADCREMPSESNCTLTITGEEREVLPVAIHHAMTVHGHQYTPEMVEQIRSMLKDES